MDILQPVNASNSPETQIDENFDSLDWGAVYAMDPRDTEDLDWVYYGGRWAGFQITGGLANKLTLTDSATNYIVVNVSDGVISVSTTDTNWNNNTNYRRVYKLTTSGGQVTVIEDHRAGPGGIHAGIARPEPIVWRVINASGNLVLADAENGVAYDSLSAGTLTIPTNASVAFPIGTSILVSQDNTGQLTVSPDVGVTLNVTAALTTKLSARWAMCSIVKRGTNTWQISGDLEKV